MNACLPCWQARDMTLEESHDQNIVVLVASVGDARKKMECYGMYLGRYKHLALSFVIIIIIDMRNVQCLVV